MKSRNKFLYAKLSLQQTLILLLAPVNLITLNIKDLYLNAVHINEYKFRWGCDKFSSAESSKLSLDNEQLLLKKKVVVDQNMRNTHSCSRMPFLVFGIISSIS